jgi:hypothetical protein
MRRPTRLANGSARRRCVGQHPFATETILGLMLAATGPRYNGVRSFSVWFKEGEF